MDEEMLKQLRTWVRAEIRLKTATGDTCGEWLEAEAEFAELVKCCSPAPAAKETRHE